MIRALGFSLYGQQAASHRVRLAQFKAGLATRGIELEIQSLLDDNYVLRRFAKRRPSIVNLSFCYAKRMLYLSRLKDFDIAIVYAELLPLMPAWVEKWMLKIPYIVDFDDAFFLKYRYGKLGLLSPLLNNKFKSLITGASGVTAGNSYLFEYAQRFQQNTTLIPSVVDTDRYQPKSEPNDNDIFTVGWIGSPSTAPYLNALIEPLSILAKEQPVRLLSVGGTPPKVPGVDTVEVAWTYEKEVEQIQQFSVSVMPLPDTPWTRGKCAYKLVQSMACGIPVIASPVGANLEVVPVSCGLFARSTGDWLAAFRELASNADLREKMGRNARQWVKRNYSIISVIPKLESVIRAAEVSSIRGY